MTREGDQNHVTLSQWNRAMAGLSEDEVFDLIDCLFKHSPGRFLVSANLTDDKRGMTLRGRLVYDEINQLYHIFLSPKNIRKAAEEGSSVGGNVPLSRYQLVGDPINGPVRLATGLVIAHEIQHANQMSMHRGEKTFFGKKRSVYRGRASEREARIYADDNVSVVAGILSLTLESVPKVVVPSSSEIDDIVDAFSSSIEVSLSDIVEELRAAGLNNAVSVAEVRRRLEIEGVSTV